MGRLREINTKAQFAFSPKSTLLVTGTAAGSLSDDLSDESKIEIYDPQLDNYDSDAFTLRPVGGVSCDERCISIAWGGVSAERPQGVIVSAMENGALDFWDPVAILNGSSKDQALLNHGNSHTGAVKCVDFSSVQPNLLASAGTKGEFFVWDTTKLSAAPTAYKSNRLDEISSLAWNKKVGHIIALGGKSGALSVWDLKKKSELIHIPTRFSVSSIAWHPTEATILLSSSSDDYNPVIQVWDLRNANAPKNVLNGHEKGVLSLSWCAQDPDLVLSSGSDNRTLIWNPTSAQIVAELPASSQWVHQVAWCKKYPNILANATLDGKICLFSIQDTVTPQTAPVIDDTPAGDDFFDSIPKNFQAQTASFTLKQTPRWLKRMSGARFGLGGKVVQFTSKSVQVEIVPTQAPSSVASSASDIKQILSNQTIAELCDAQRNEAKENEKQDWDIIKTLTSEHARDALRTYLGFTKEDVAKEVSEKFGGMSLETAKEKAADAPSSDSKVEPAEDPKPTESSVFDEGSAEAEVDFMGIINSQVPAAVTNSTAAATHEQRKSSFQILDETSSDADKLITKAIFTGQFESAIEVCLREDRMSDAFMLALCGGTESQKRVQEAYFKKTDVPYGRLLSSIVAGDLADVVKNADLAHWKELMAILCNYAKPDEFLNLCEIMGQRLEGVDGQQSAAVLCYLAGEKLDHLTRIWSTKQEEREKEALAHADSTSPYDLHVQGLVEMIKKISIFRKAVSFVDSQTKQGDNYTLAGLYSLYLEFAQVIAAEGDLVTAAEYVALVPINFDGAEALKNRLIVPAKPSAQSAQRTTGMRQAGMRNVYTQAAAVAQPPASPVPRAGLANPSQAVEPAHNPPFTNHQATAPSRPAYAPNPYANQSVQQNGHQPSPYGQPLASAANQGQSQYQIATTNGQYQAQAPTQAAPYSSFAPPPSRITSNGPTILPAAQRKDITPWNDAPDIPLPAARRATPAVNRSNITSPFQAAPTPTLQSFGPPQPQPIAPPPKSAPQRAPSTNAPAASTQQINRPPPNAYAPQPQIASAQAAAARTPNNPYAPSPNQYQANTQNIAAPYQQQQQAPTQMPPQIANHAPPPTAFAPPPRVASGPPKGSVSRAAPPAASKSPAVAKSIVNLTPESSRQNSPVQEKFEFPATRYPPGDRTHMPESDRPIEQDLSNLLLRLQRVAPERYRRPLEDTQKRFNVLFDLLNNTQLTDGTREQLRIASAALRNSDWSTAWAIHNELTQDKMHECRAWIAGIKTLVVVGKKSVEENWQ